MKKFLITLSPAKQYRSGLNFYLKIVSATSAKNAKLLAPVAWPVGDGCYNKVQCVELNSQLESDRVFGDITL